MLRETELKKLSYEEAKELNIKLEKNGYFGEVNNDSIGIMTIGNTLLKVTSLTNDDDFNKVLFEEMKTKKHPAFFFDQIKHDIEYTKGNRDFPSGTISLNEAQGNYSPLSSYEYKNLDIQKFLINIIAVFDKMLSNLPYYRDREETEESLNTYKELQKKYHKKVDEKNAILESLTKK